MIKSIKQFFFIAGLLLIAAGAQPVGAAFWQWSTTAATNGNADPSINWSEGMSPSSVNDSARAMMAVLAAFRIDNGGGLITGGASPTAYTLTTSQPFAIAADLDGQSIAFIISPTNGANPTLNVNGIGAFPLITENGAPVPAGSMHDGRIYHVTFNNANSAFRVHDSFENAFNIPLGGILWSTASTPPNSNFVAPSGQCISTTTYAAYWVQQGSPASGACPGGQFAIIDMRGRIPAALDTLNASAAGRLTSASTGCGTAFTSIGVVCANGSQSHTMSVLELVAHSHANSLSDPGHDHTSFDPSVRTSRLIGNAGAGVGSPFVTVQFNNGTADNIRTTINTTGISITNASAGSTQPFPIVPNVIGLIPYLRVL